VLLVLLALLALLVLLLVLLARVVEPAEPPVLPQGVAAAVTQRRVAPGCRAAHRVAAPAPAHRADW
jgi:hypothetical protein